MADGTEKNPNIKEAELEDQLLLVQLQEYFKDRSFILVHWKVDKDSNANVKGLIPPNINFNELVQVLRSTATVYANRI